MASVTFGDPDDFNPFFKHWNARILFVATRDAVNPVNEMDARFLSGSWLPCANRHAHAAEDDCLGKLGAGGDSVAETLTTLTNLR